MADIRESFPTLEVLGTNVGAPINQAVPGTAASAIVSTIAAPVYQDANGNLVFPTLTSSGAIAVDTNAVVGSEVYAAASAAGSLSEVVVATAVLVPSKKVEDIAIEVSCRRGARFRLAYNNNGTESTLGYYVVDSGQYTFGQQLLHAQFTAATGTQSLKVYGINFDKASDLYGYVGCIQY